MSRFSCYADYDLDSYRVDAAEDAAREREAIRQSRYYAPNDPDAPEFEDDMGEEWE